jgi:hypothetical protein
VSTPRIAGRVHAGPVHPAMHSAPCVSVSSQSVSVSSQSVSVSSQSVSVSSQSVSVSSQCVSVSSQSVSVSSQRRTLRRASRHGLCVSPWPIWARGAQVPGGPVRVAGDGVHVSQVPGGAGVAGGGVGLRRGPRLRPLPRRTPRRLTSPPPPPPPDRRRRRCCGGAVLAPRAARAAAAPRASARPG